MAYDVIKKILTQFIHFDIVQSNEVDLFTILKFHF